MKTGNYYDGLDIIISSMNYQILTVANEELKIQIVNSLQTEIL